MNHPEIARLLIADRQRDLLARAEEHRTARSARRLRKQQAARPAQIAVPPIPDFVDGTFREDQPTTTITPAQAAVPAARHAA